ncbi:MAG: lipid-A-disaccharide synthase [Alphaproteobacteria bacterium]|nr:lipid-A-disaccharide synthase [Alphaproteobacteria bacterium]
MKIFFIVGEASGDSLAASLVKALKKIPGEDFEFLGVGGQAMKDAGVNVMLPMDEICVMGLLEVIPKIPKLLKIKTAIVEEIEKQKPDAVITVDLPDFNFMVGKDLKNRKNFTGKLIHYVAPSVWAWRPSRAQNVAQFLDGMMCLFSMEVEHFTKHGLYAEHVGHPLLEKPVHDTKEKMFRTQNDIAQDATVLGLFFGSRKSEFKNHGKILRKAAEYIHQYGRPIHIIAPTLPDKQNDILEIMQGCKVPFTVTSSPLSKWDSIQACDFAIAVSGTIGLELAYAGIPHITAYKANPLTVILVRMLAKIKHIHLANILLEEEIVPEFIQGQCNAENLAQEAIKLIKSEEKQQAQKVGFSKIENILRGSSDLAPSDQAAKCVLKIIRENPKPPKVVEPTKEIAQKKEPPIEDGSKESAQKTA